MSEIVITELQLKKILEQVGMIEGSPLYHHTSVDRALKIIEQNKLRGSVPSEHYLEIDKRLKNSKYQSAISFTRDKNFEPGMSIGASWQTPKDLDVIFVLDRNKLKTKYKVEPFNYSFLDPVINKDFGSYEKNPELEERVLAKHIYPLDKYVVDIIYKGDDPKVQMAIDDFLNKEWNDELIQELAPNSSGVQEFINHVKETPGLLKHLGFRRYKDLEEYIQDGNYTEFQELKDDAKEFEKRLNEQEEFEQLPKAIIKIFKILNTEKKKYKKRSELEEYLKKVMGYVGLDPVLAKYYIETYVLNYRPEGDYENLNKSNFIDPRTQRGKRITNPNAYQYTKALMPFRGSNLEGYWTEDLNKVPVYVVKSYGWYPVFIYKSGIWYEVTGKYSSSTARQMSNADPGRGEKRWERNLESEVYLMTPDEMKSLLSKGTHSELMKAKAESLVKRKEELQKKRMKSLATYSWHHGNNNVRPDEVKIKFRIKDVEKSDDKIHFIIDVVDVLEKVRNRGIPSDKNYTKGDFVGVDKNSVEKYIIRSITRDYRDYIGKRPDFYDVEPEKTNFKYTFNHLKENQ